MTQCLLQNLKEFITRSKDKTMNFDDQVEKSAYCVTFFNSTLEHQKKMIEEVKQSHPGHPVIAELEAMHETVKTL